MFSRQGLLLLLPIQTTTPCGHTRKWPSHSSFRRLSLSPSTIPPKPVRKIITRKVYGSTIRNPCRVCLPLVFASAVVVVVVFASRLSALAKQLGQRRVRDDSSHGDGKWTPVGLDRCQLLDYRRSPTLICFKCCVNNDDLDTCQVLKSTRSSDTCQRLLTLKSTRSSKISKL